jgi:FkbM family methyltransferase
MQSYSIIDVGASIGLFSAFMASRQNNEMLVDVIAVEPLVDVATSIPKLPNITVVNKILTSKKNISDQGKVSFFRSKSSELSSRHRLNPQINEVLWREHLTGMQDYEVLELPAITLQDLIREHGLGHIDFIKIDAQGDDLEILLSAGDQLEKIMSCVLEFPYSEEAALYEDEPTVLDGITKMQEIDFLPLRICPNGAGEANVFFLNKKFEIGRYFDLEKNLDFSKAPTLKIGVHDGSLEYLKKKSFARLFTEKIRYELSK